MRRPLGWTLFTLLFLLFIDGMSQGVVFPLLADSLLHHESKLLSSAHKIDATGNIIYGLLIGSFYLFWFLGAPLLSDYSDKVGRKKVLMICLIGSFLGFFFTALGFAFNSITLLFIGRIVNGATAGSQPISQATVVDICPEDKKTRFFGYILLAVCGGMVLGPIIGAFFSNRHILPFFNNEMPMYVSMLLTLINLLLFLRYFTETRENVVQEKLKISKSITVFVSAFTNKAVRKLSVVYFLTQMGWSMFYFYNNSLLIKEFKFTGSTVALYIGALGVGITIGFTLLVRCFEKVNKKSCVIIGYGLVLLGTIVSILARSPVWFWIFVVPAGAGMGLAYSNILAIFSLQATADQQGWVMGITTAMMAASAAIMAAIIGPLSKINLLLPFIVSGSLLLLGLIMMLFDKKATASDLEGLNDVHEVA